MRHQKAQRRKEREFKVSRVFPPGKAFGCPGRSPAPQSTVLRKADITERNCRRIRIISPFRGEACLALTKDMPPLGAQSGEPVWAHKHSPNTASAMRGIDRTIFAPVRLCVRFLPPLTLALAVLTPARASASDYELRGYLKDYPATWEQNDAVWSISGTRSRTWFNSTRGRLKFRCFAAQHMTFVADYEARLALTNRAGSLYGLTSASDAGLLNMTWTPVNRDHVTLTHTIDRLYAQWFSKHFVATVGRQRIAWGVSDYFSPLDKFAPFAPAEIDKEEKVGVDAILVSIPWGARSRTGKRSTRWGVSAHDKIPISVRSTRRPVVASALGSVPTYMIGTSA